MEAAASRTSACTPTSSPGSTAPRRSSLASLTTVVLTCGAWRAYSPSSTPATPCSRARTRLSKSHASWRSTACPLAPYWTSPSEARSTSTARVSPSSWRTARARRGRQTQRTSARCSGAPTEASSTFCRDASAGTSPIGSPRTRRCDIRGSWARNPRVGRRRARTRTAGQYRRRPTRIKFLEGRRLARPRRRGRRGRGRTRARRRVWRR